LTGFSDIGNNYLAVLVVSIQIACFCRGLSATKCHRWGKQGRPASRNLLMPTPPLLRCGVWRYIEFWVFNFFKDSFLYLKAEHSKQSDWMANGSFTASPGREAIIPGAKGHSRFSRTIHLFFFRFVDITSAINAIIL